MSAHEHTLHAKGNLAVNQFTVIEGQHKRRSDIVIFLNGLPLGLIELAKELDAATKRGEALGPSGDEAAFYDALAANESAVIAMGNDKLKVVAAKHVTQVRKSVTTDWTLREGARARIRVMVKRILNQYGYPLDLQDEAVKTVVAQAELMSAEWAEAVNIG